MRRSVRFPDGPSGLTDENTTTESCQSDPDCGTVDRMPTHPDAVAVPPLNGHAAAPAGVRPFPLVTAGNVPASSRLVDWAVPDSLRGGNEREPDTTRNREQRERELGNSGNGEPGTGNCSVADVTADRRAATRPDPGNKEAENVPGVPVPGSAAPAKDPSTRTARMADLRRTAVIGSVVFAATVIASDGQIGVWAWSGLDSGDPRRFLIPFLADIAVYAWLMIAEGALRANMPYRIFVFLAAVSSSFAVFLNVQHAPFRQALIYGAASTLCALLIFADFMIRFHKIQVEKKKKAGTRPSTIGFSSLSQPLLDLRAWRITVRRPEVTTVDDARKLADEFTWVLQDSIAQLRQTRRTVIDGRARIAAREQAGTISDDEAANLRAQLPTWPRKIRRTARRTAWLHVSRRAGAETIVPKAVQLAEVTVAAPPVALPAPAAVASLPAGPPPAARRVRASATVAQPALPRSRTVADITTQIDRTWLATYDRHIRLVQDHYPNWRDRNITVDDCKKVPGVKKHETALRVVKCLIHLRRGGTG